MYHLSDFMMCVINSKKVSIAHPHNGPEAWFMFPVPPIWFWVSTKTAGPGNRHILTTGNELKETFEGQEEIGNYETTKLQQRIYTLHTVKLLSPLHGWSYRLIYMNIRLYWLSSDDSQALGSWKFCTGRLEGWRCQKLQVCPPNFYTCKHFVSLCVGAEARTWSGPKRRVRGSEWSEQERYSDVVTALFTSAKARSEARGILWT